MINVLTKYKSGGVTSAEKAQFDKAFKMAAKNTGVDENMLIEAISSVKDENQQKDMITAVAMAAEGDQNAIKAIQGWFKKSSFKSGGKVHDFICKHSAGGRTDCGCNGTKIKMAKDGTPKVKSSDKTVTVRGMGTPKQKVSGTYSYPSTNGDFEFGPYGRTARVWGNNGGWPIHRYADEEWIRRHPRRQLLPGFLGGHKEVAPEGFFENLEERVTNRFPDIRLQPGGEIPEGYNLSRREVIKRLMSDNGLSRIQAAQEYNRRARRIGTDSQGTGVSPRDFGRKGTNREQVAYDLLNSGVQGDYRREYRQVLRGMRRNSDLTSMGYGNYRDPEFGRNRNDGSLKQLAKEAVKARHPLSTILYYDYDYETGLPNIRPYGNPGNSTAAYDTYTPEYKESLMNEGSYYDTDTDYNPGIDTRMHRSADGTTLNFGPNGGSVKRAYDEKGGKIKKKK